MTDEQMPPPARVMTILIVEAVLLLVITVVTGWLVWRQQSLAHSTNCQVTYNSAFAEAQGTRARLADQDRTATGNLIRSVFTTRPGETRAQQDAALLAAYQSYVAAEATITAQRAANPIPSLPHC